MKLVRVLFTSLFLAACQNPTVLGPDGEAALTAAITEPPVSGTPVIEPPVTEPPAPEPPSYQVDVAPIFEKYCSRCHGSRFPRAGLQLVGAPAADLYAALVDVPSTQLPSMDLIEPGNPAASYLVNKVNNTQGGLGCPRGCGRAMPPRGAGLTPDELDTVNAWVLAGAQF